MDELSAVLERQRAERVQRRELADAVPGGDDASPTAPSARSSASWAAASATSAGCVNSVRNRTPCGMAAHAAVGEPQLARVALDDVEQREAERARACARRRAPTPPRGT